MPWSIDEKFKIPANKAIVVFILRHDSLSAHDEVAEVLMRSAQGISKVQSYCPNIPSYAYFVLHTGAHVIFGIAFGQRALAYRLPSDCLAEAIAAGGKVDAEIGQDWVVFDPWQTTPPLNAALWCKKARDCALLIHI